MSSLAPDEGGLRLLAGLDRLPLTGDSTRDDVADLAVERRPTFVLERIDELLHPGSWQG